MRRFVIFSAVALLAFGIGFYFFHIFTFPTAKENEEFSKALQDKVKVEQFISHLPKDFQIEKSSQSILCDDKSLNLVWENLKHEIDELTMSDSNFGSNCIDYFSVEKTVDLNADGKLEVFVSSNFAARNNSYWIFQTKDNKNFHIIFEGFGEIEVKPNRTNGYMDLEESIKISIPEYEKSLFQFEGNSYKPQKCWTEIIAARDKNDMIYELKKSKKFPHPCP